MWWSKSVEVLQTCHCIQRSPSLICKQFVVWQLKRISITTLPGLSNSSCDKYRLTFIQKQCPCVLVRLNSLKDLHKNNQTVFHKSVKCIKQSTNSDVYFTIVRFALKQNENIETHFCTAAFKMHCWSVDYANREKNQYLPRLCK